MIGNEPTEKILVNIPASVKRELRRRAKEERVTLSALVNRFLAAGLNIKLAPLYAADIDRDQDKVEAIVTREKVISRTMLLRRFHFGANRLNQAMRGLLDSGVIAVERRAGAPKKKPTTIIKAL